MVVLTFALAVSAWQSCRIAAKAMREQNRPHIVVSPCFIDHECYFGVSLRNCGLSTAYDIRFKWNTAPISPWPSMATSKDSKFLREPIGSLRAGNGYKMFLGVMSDLKKQNEELVYRGQVSYKDSTGKTYVEDLVVDFRMFDKRGIIPDDVDSDTVKVLMRIDDQLQGIRRYVDHLLAKERNASLLRKIGLEKHSAGDGDPIEDKGGVESDVAAEVNGTGCRSRGVVGSVVDKCGAE